MSMELRRLAGEIAGLRREVRAGTTTRQLAYSSIEDGGRLRINDSAGREVMTVGGSPDGSFGSNVRVGPTPPTPNPPLMIATASGMTVRWGGEWTDSLMTPDDFTRVEVHLSADQNMTMETADTLVGTIESPRGGDVVVTKLQPETLYYAGLVARNTAGGRGPASQMVAAETLAIPDGPGTAKAAEDARRAAEAAAAATAAADSATSEANSARAAAVAAQADATTALDAANGVNKIWYSTEDPTPEDGKDGDTWYYRSHAGPNETFGKISAVYEKISGVWQPRRLEANTIDSITAGQISSGTIGAATLITVGRPFKSDGTNEPQAYLTIGQSSLQVFRPDGEGAHVPTLSLGGATADTMLLTDTAGETLAGFDEHGYGQAQFFTTPSLEVGGNSLGDPYWTEDTLFMFPRGRVAGLILYNNSPQANSELGLAEVSWDMEPRRLYKVVFDGRISATTSSSSWRLFLRYTVGSDGAAAPAPQVGTSTQLSTGFYSNGAAQYDTEARCHIEGFLFYNHYDQARAMVSLQRLIGGYPWYNYDGRGYLYVEDVGPVSPNPSEIWADGQMTLGGGTPHANPGGVGVVTPPTARKTYTRTYAANWSRTWRGSSLQSGDEMRQGYSGSSKLRSAFGVPSQMSSDIAGSTVAKVEMYVHASHWYYHAGGALWFGAHTASSAPGSFPSPVSTEVSQKWTSKTGGKWITLPASWYPYFANGTYKGISIGNFVPSSSNTYYARLYGASSSSYRPRLRVTYSK